MAQSKIPDFYRPNCDPSINANGGIMYAFGEDRKVPIDSAIVAIIDTIEQS